MRLLLHEVELNTQDLQASRTFYHELLGLPVMVDQDGLKVFDTGWPGVDLDTSVHNPGKNRISFLVDDLDAFVAEMQSKGRSVGEIYQTHLAMRAVSFEDPDGNRVEIQCPTQQSPSFLKDMLAWK